MTKTTLTGIALKSAKSLGQAGQRVGFKDCARTGNWERIAS
ncbi:hypothetical protein [Nonomuraea endophytica]|uniref:Uncharacterized protein n=1 Tax=Nonomuraea endophytica TaxID=714136 RepID=A0A7W8EGX2_9ACTN|nr:hypothetical protein [Nonomuraea endophytica]MBB5077967.1 hypothetical protein [Nonomuraea endophytica]